jgi:hypothetical protein
MVRLEHHHGGASGGAVANGLGLLPQSALLVLAAAMAGIAAAQLGARTIAPTPARTVRAATAALTAAVLAALALTTRGEHFLRQAVTSGWTEQSWWALALGLLLLRVAADPGLLREPPRSAPPRTQTQRE